jgi:hypothetical protein
MLPVVIAAPTAYFSAFHHRAAYAIPACEEIPHPDDEYLEGHLWVNSITGGPNESPVQQVNFTTPQLTPLQRLELVPDFTRGRQVEARALGRTRSPSKMLGRKNHLGLYHLRT